MVATFVAKRLVLSAGITAAILDLLDEHAKLEWSVN